MISCFMRERVIPGAERSNLTSALGRFQTRPEQRHKATGEEKKMCEISKLIREIDSDTVRRPRTRYTNVLRVTLDILTGVLGGLCWQTRPGFLFRFHPPSSYYRPLHDDRPLPVNQPYCGVLMRRDKLRAANKVRLSPALIFFFMCRPLNMQFSRLSDMRY